MRSLSAEDRALIDAAIAEGRVQKVETGTWTMPVYSSQNRKLGHQIIRPGVPIPEAPVICRRTGRELPPPPPSKAEKNRQAEVQGHGKVRERYERLAARKMTVQAIAGKLGITASDARRALRRYGLTVREAGNPLEEQYRKLVAEGLHIGEIARRLKRHPSTVATNLARFGLEAKPCPVRVGRRKEERRERYAEYIKQGLTAREMAHNLGVTNSTVRRDLQALGMWPLP